MNTCLSSVSKLHEKKHAEYVALSSELRTLMHLRYIHGEPNITNQYMYNVSVLQNDNNLATA